MILSTCNHTESLVQSPHLSGIVGQRKCLTVAPCSGGCASLMKHILLFSKVQIMMSNFQIFS